MATLDPKDYLWRNIAFLMKVEDPTIDAVQRKTGIGRGTAQRIMEGKTSVGIDVIRTIANSFGVEAWQLTHPNLASVLHGVSLAPTSNENNGMSLKNKPDELVIPQFDTGGAMGGGLLLRDQPGVIKGWSVNQEWISKNIKSHTGTANLCIVTGFGDSMKGMFNSGDPLVIDRGTTSVEYDAVYFFRVADEGFIKRLQRIPGEGLRVLSENKKYESWTIKPDMDFEVFGRVLKAWQGEDF